MTVPDISDADLTLSKRSMIHLAPSEALDVQPVDHKKRKSESKDNHGVRLSLSEAGGKSALRAKKLKSSNKKTDVTNLNTVGSYYDDLVCKKGPIIVAVAAAWVNIDFVDMIKNNEPLRLHYIEKMKVALEKIYNILPTFNFVIDLINSFEPKDSPVAVTQYHRKQTVQRKSENKDFVYNEPSGMFQIRVECEKLTLSENSGHKSRTKPYGVALGTLEEEVFDEQDSSMSLLQQPILGPSTPSRKNSPSPFTFQDDITPPEQHSPMSLLKPPIPRPLTPSRGKSPSQFSYQEDVTPPEQDSSMSLLKPPIPGPLTPSRKNSPSPFSFQDDASPEVSSVSDRWHRKRKQNDETALFFIVANKLTSITRVKLELIATKLKQFQGFDKSIKELYKIASDKDITPLTSEEAEHIVVIANTIHSCWKEHQLQLKQNNPSFESQLINQLRLILEMDDVAPILIT